MCDYNLCDGKRRTMVPFHKCKRFSKLFLITVLFFGKGVFLRVCGHGRARARNRARAVGSASVRACARGRVSA